MKTVLYLLIVLFGLVPTLRAQSYEELVDKASEALAADSLSQAEALFRQALKVDPANVQNAMLFSNLGLVQQREGHLSDALESYNYALNLSPRMVPILLNRAALYLELEKYDLARIDYSLVLDFEPKNPEALLMRAYAYSQLRSYKLAEADYDRLLQFSPLHFRARLGLALIYQKEGKRKEAKDYLTAMLSVKTVEDNKPISNEQLSLVYSSRAGVEMDNLEYGLAMYDLNEAIRLDPSNADNYISRGQVYLKQKRKDQAKKDFELAVAHGTPISLVHDFLKQTR